MERQQIYGLALLAVTVTIGLVLSLMLTNAFRGRAERPAAGPQPVPAPATPGLSRDEVLRRLQK
jgi:hypothetical protein